MNGPMKWLRDTLDFLKNVANDERIPATDKKILLVMLALLASPFDIIPDWIPVIGWMDDIVILAIVLDYLFNHLDQEILLSHYPWGMKSFVRTRRLARMVAAIAPGWVKQKVWSYKPSVY